MTKAQRTAHKKGNQLRKDRLIRLYYKTKPSALGWLDKPGFIQNGKFTP